LKKIKWTSPRKSHHLNQIENLNKIFSSLEVDQIKSQLALAKSQKNKLIKNLYREYVNYLETVRGLLFDSVKKGVEGIIFDKSTKNVYVSNSELSALFEEKLNVILKSQLPFFTIEQLIISTDADRIDQEINEGDLNKFSELKNFREDNSEIKNEFISQDSYNFQDNGNIYNLTDYYQDKNENSSLDLDNRDNNNYFQNNESVENLVLEKPLYSSLQELLQDNEQSINGNFKNLNKNITNLHSQYQYLEIFDHIENSLSNLLLDISYKINIELFKSKLIKKIISEDSFTFLLDKDFLIRHPHPFVINFDLNIGQMQKSLLKLQSILLFSITIVELEFKNLNLSIQRNKMTDLKNQFQLLIKKEKYWKQKEINLNNI